MTAAVLFAYNFLKNPDSLINDVLTELTSEYYKQKIKATHANQKKDTLHLILLCLMNLATPSN